MVTRADQRDPQPQQEAPARIRVGLVTTYPLLREAIRHVLRMHRAIEVVGDAGHPAAALDLVRHDHPDVLFILSSGGGLDEIDLIQRVLALGRPVRLLLLSADTSEHAALRTLRAGAHGILSPTMTTSDMVGALQSVHAGNLYLTPELQRACAERYLGVDASKSPEERLSDREFQVMRMLALGDTNREIAARLGVGVKTIDTHRANLLRKLGLRNNADIARFAIKSGTVEA